MRILHTSDWHLGKMLENISRLDEQREFVDELVRIADREEVHMVIIAGDIFDTYTPSSAAEELFYDALDKLNHGGQRAVLVIAGNHDSPERLCAASPLACKNGIILLGYPASDAGQYPVNNGKVSIAASGPGWVEIKVSSCNQHAVVLTLPYPSEARLEEVLAEEADELKLQKAYSDRVGSILSRLAEKFREDTINLVVSHLFMRGGKESDSERTVQVGGAMTVDPQVLPEKAHYVALGHLHRPQWVGGSPCPACYSGSPLAYSFSEADYSKAVYIVEAEPGEKAHVHEVLLNSGKPLRRWVAKEGVEEALRWCEEGRDPHAWVDLEIYTDQVLSMEDQKRLRELHPGIISIRPHLLGEEAAELTCENRESRKLDELFKEYYRHRMGLEISDELMAAFLEVVNDQEETREQDDSIEAPA